MKKHTTLLLTSWGILATIFALFYFTTHLHEKQTNDLLTQSLTLHKQAISNEAKSYQAINDCFVVNRGVCNPEEFKNTLQVLGDEADEIYSKISSIENKLK